MTRIVQVRLSGEPKDVTQLASMIAQIPGVTATGAGLRENRKDPGVRRYLTVAIDDEMRNRDDSTSA
jgi:hypothetical protein